MFQSLIILRLLIKNYLSQIRVFLDSLNFLFRNRLQIAKHLINIDPICRKLCLGVGYLFVRGKKLLFYIHFCFLDLCLKVQKLFRTQCTKFIKLHRLPIVNMDRGFFLCDWCIGCSWNWFAGDVGILNGWYFSRSHLNNSFPKSEYGLGQQIPKYLHALVNKPQLITKYNKFQNSHKIITKKHK